MGRDDKLGFKHGHARRKERSKDQGSDESDEDFMIGEGEEFESDEYCSSLDPDESEEALLELEFDEEDEEEVPMKVKKAARSKTRKTVSAKKRKRSKKKPKKKSRFSYKQEEDYDDDFIEDDDDVEFIPDEIDYVDHDDETPVIKKRKVSYREEEEEEDNDDDDGDDDYNNEDEKEEDEDNEMEGDREFTLDAIDFEDEEDDMLLQNKDKKVRNPNPRERGFAKGRERRRSSDVMKKPTSTTRKPRTKHRLVRKTRSATVPRLARKSSSGTDRELANKSLVVEDRSKKIHFAQRKYVASSDSDFVGVASSDNEYTTPGKERERHRLEGKTSSDIAPIARLARKRSAATDGEFANKNLMGEDRSKKTSVRRRRKYVASSDSEFLSPASDYDYTISEEEREQVREADKFCNSLNTNSRTSSSLKKCEEEDICKQRKRPARKGKEKLEDLNKVVKQVCGICLSEEGKRTIRGTLNSCSHFFCFACIMEWSKVESRCPLCKQRFATISKPARSDSGFDLRTVIIQVPERDQVYQPSEDELRGFLDPYDGVMCTECQQGGDDALMLLCDICDSPAHTYCVGLGREVPEGNWYCEGCRPAASSAPSPHGLNPALDQRASNFLSSLSSPVHNVGELDLNSLYVPDTPLTQQIGPFPIPRRFGSEFHVASPTSGAGVFTVHDRRRIRQIHHVLNTRRNPTHIQSNEMPSTTSGIRLFGSQIDGGTGQAIQRTVTPEMRTLEYTSHHGRLQDNTNTYLPNWDASSSRSIMMSEQGQNSEHGGIGMVFNSRLAYEQLYPCNSRSNIDSEDPSYTFREPIHSRTSQGSLRRPF